MPVSAAPGFTRLDRGSRCDLGRSAIDPVCLACFDGTVFGELDGADHLYGAVRSLRDRASGQHNSSGPCRPPDRGW